jgi:hypothetical protein
VALDSADTCVERSDGFMARQPEKDHSDEPGGHGVS